MPPEERFPCNCGLAKEEVEGFRQDAKEALRTGDKFMAGMWFGMVETWQKILKRRKAEHQEQHLERPCQLPLELG